MLDSNNTPISQRLGSASEASAVSGTSAFAKINTLSSDLTNKVPFSKLTFADARANLADLLATITFSQGIYMYEFWDSVCRGVLIMASVNNNYGVGIYLSYYSSNNFERVENVNRTFTISAL